MIQPMPGYTFRVPWWRTKRYPRWAMLVVGFLFGIGVGVLL
jgi:hypothetical protein